MRSGQAPPGLLVEIEPTADTRQMKLLLTVGVFESRRKPEGTARSMKRVRTLGDLEAEVMNIVWSCSSVTVKDVNDRLSRERAYNTVQTTLDRLYRKDLLVREKQSHAFVYRPRLERAEYHRRLMSGFFRELLQSERASVLAAFIDTAAAADIRNLERLEELIQTKRLVDRKRS